MERRVEMQGKPTLEYYRECADKIARYLPGKMTPNPFLTKEDFDEVLESLNITLINSERWYILGLLEGIGFVHSIFDAEDVIEIHLTKEYCETCRKKPGQPRSDNGLPSGNHCDHCWEELKESCRQRSW